jgi:hypothetical protein
MACKMGESLDLVVAGGISQLKVEGLPCELAKIRFDTTMNEASLSARASSTPESARSFR